MAISIDYRDRQYRGTRAEQTFPFVSDRLVEPDKTVACVRHMRQAWKESPPREPAVVDENELAPVDDDQRSVPAGVNSSHTVLHVSGSRTESLFEDVVEEDRAPGTPRSSLSATSSLRRDDPVVGNEEEREVESQRPKRRRSLRVLLDRVCVESKRSRGEENITGRILRSSIKEESDVVTVSSPPLVTRREPSASDKENDPPNTTPMTSSPAFSSPLNVFTSTQVRMTNTPECLRDRRLSSVASSAVGDASVVVQHDDGRRTVFVSPPRRHDVTLRNVGMRVNGSPVFKVPALPGARFARSPMGVASSPGIWR